MWPIANFWFFLTIYLSKTKHNTPTRSPSKSSQTQIFWQQTESTKKSTEKKKWTQVLLLRSSKTVYRRRRSKLAHHLTLIESQRYTVRIQNQVHETQTSSWIRPRWDHQNRSIYKLNGDTASDVRWDWVWIMKVKTQKVAFRKPGRSTLCGPSNWSKCHWDLRNRFINDGDKTSNVKWPLIHKSKSRCRNSKTRRQVVCGRRRAESKPAEITQIGQ